MTQRTDDACEIRVAAAGVGSSLSGMLQAVELYRQGRAEGLLHINLGRYSPSCVRLVAALDVDKRKISKPVEEALFLDDSHLPRFTEFTTGVQVEPGVLLDDILHDKIDAEGAQTSEVEKLLESTKPDVFLNLVNSGMNRSTEEYARICARKGVAFVNASPTPVATSEELEALYRSRRVPLLGDDLLSQIGGTVFHAILLSLLNSRGVRIRQTYQLDVGGGLENMLTVYDDELRLSKRNIKSSAVGSVLPYSAAVATGTTEYVDFMGNSRESHFEIVGSYTLGAPIEIEITLKSFDGANAAGPLLDAVRAAKVAKERGVGGAVEEVNPYLFKLVRSKVDPISAQRAFVTFFSQ